MKFVFLRFTFRLWLFSVVCFLVCSFAFWRTPSKLVPSNATGGEVHLFVVWHNGMPQIRRVIQDIRKSFLILQRTTFQWPSTGELEASRDAYLINLWRLYNGKGGGSRKGMKEKVAQCGRGAFEAVVVLDENPTYGDVRTAHGVDFVNLRMHEKKTLYRRWTRSGGFAVHGTYNLDEAFHDIRVLLGIDPLTLYGAFQHQSEESAVSNAQTFGLESDDGVVKLPQQWHSCEDFLFAIHSVRLNNSYAQLSTFEGRAMNMPPFSSPLIPCHLWTLESQVTFPPKGMWGVLSLMNGYIDEEKSMPIEDSYVPFSAETKAAYKDLLYELAKLTPPGAATNVVDVAEQVIPLLRGEGAPEEKQRLMQRLLDSEVPLSAIASLGNHARQLNDYFERAPVLPGNEFELSSASGSSSPRSSLLEDSHPRDMGNSAIDFWDVATNTTYLEGELRHRLPTVGPQEAVWMSERVSQVLSLPASDTRIAAQLQALLGAESFNEWVTAAVHSRWAIVYGRAYASATTEKMRSNVISQLKSHAETDDAVMTLYTSIIGKEVTVDKRSSHRAPKLVDLEALEKINEQKTFPSVPKGTKLCRHEKYDEIIFPVVHRESDYSVTKCLRDLPTWCQEAFFEETLNIMQSTVCDTAFSSSSNMLVSAPTGAGKTIVALLAILGILKDYRIEESGAFRHSEFKVLYIAPMKALVQEMVSTFTKRLSPFGVVVRELTGDSRLSKHELTESQMLVATPEKWDVVSRKGDAISRHKVRLIILDEVHLLHSDRGPVLEAIVARTPFQATRLVGLSATLPNYEDVARFLRVDASKGLFAFDASYRPVPLQQQFCIAKKIPGTVASVTLNDICCEKVTFYAVRAQVLVFVHSRKDTLYTASYILAKAAREGKLSIFSRGGLALQQIKEKIANCPGSDEALIRLLLSGVGVHHAGMRREERSLVESLYNERLIQVLISTSTLAWGVNLPAYAVIIKGTQVYSTTRGCRDSLPLLDVLQMFGRAGRKGLEVEGHACIITSDEEVKRYIGALSNQSPIESFLIRKIVDAINAEVALGNITSLVEGVQWIQSTYFYIRLHRAPERYGGSLDSADSHFYSYREDLVHTALYILNERGMVSYDTSERTVRSTRLGHVASKYYVTYRTVERLVEALSLHAHDVDVLSAFARCSEFDSLLVRADEAREVELLAEQAPIAISAAPHSSAGKIGVLLLCHIGRISLHGLALNTEKAYVSDTAERLLWAMYEICVGKNLGALSRRCLHFYIMVKQQVWITQSPLRQLFNLPTIPSIDSTELDSIVEQMERCSTSWRRFQRYSLDQNVEFCRGNEDQGERLANLVGFLPVVTIERSAARPFSSEILLLEVVYSISLRSRCNERQVDHEFAFFVEDTTGKLLHHETAYISEEEMVGCATYETIMAIPIGVMKLSCLYIYVESTEWLGVSSSECVSLISLILPPPRSPQTTCIVPRDEATFEMVLPSSLLEAASQVFPYSSLSSLQQEIVPSVLLLGNRSRRNMLLCSPPGSGKSFAAELLVLKFLSEEGEGAKGQLLYLTCRSDTAQRRFEEWEAKFGFLTKVAPILDPLIPFDVEELHQAKVLVAAPEALRPLLPQLSNVRYVIADHLHLISTPAGRAYETILPRLINCSAGGNSESAVPLLAFMYPVEEVSVICEWLDVDVFSHPRSLFHLTGRSSPMNLMVEAMEWTATLPKAREQARLVALRTLRLVSWRQSRVVLWGATPSRCTELALDIVLERSGVRPVATVEHTFLFENGVALLHEEMSEEEQQMTLTAIEKAAQELHPLVVIATLEQSWKLEAASLELSLVMDAERCTVAEVLQLVSRGGGGALLLAPASKAWLWRRACVEPLPLVSDILTPQDGEDFMIDAIGRGHRTIEELMMVMQQLYFVYHGRVNPQYYDIVSSAPKELAEAVSKFLDEVLQSLEEKKLILGAKFTGDHIALSPIGDAIYQCGLPVAFVMDIANGLDHSAYFSLDDVLRQLYCKWLIAEPPQWKGQKREVKNIRSLRIFSPWSEKSDAELLYQLAQMTLSGAGNDDVIIACGFRLRRRTLSLLRLLVGVIQWMNVTLALQLAHIYQCFAATRPLSTARLSSIRVSSPRCYLESAADIVQGTIYITCHKEVVPCWVVCVDAQNREKAFAAAYVTAISTIALVANVENVQEPCALVIPSDFLVETTETVIEHN